MQTVLIITGDDTSGSLLEDTAAAAGFVGVRPRAGEEREQALERIACDVVLADANMTVSLAFMRHVERGGGVFILVSASLSPYELSSRARDLGVVHFNQSAGPAGLARAVADGLALARLPAQRRAVAAAASASVQRARDLTAQAGDVLATSNELRIANRIALAACRMNRLLLRETVVACTLDLRRTGMALDLVVELVTAAVEGSAVDHPASRAEVEAEAAAAAQWAIEAWRAA
jgi:hypothetical protein